MKAIKYSLPLIASSVCTTVQATPHKIASYNIKYLPAGVNSVKELALRETFLKLDADVIALQEIKARRARIIGS